MYWPETRLQARISQWSRQLFPKWNLENLNRNRSHSRTQRVRLRQSLRLPKKALTHQRKHRKFAAAQKVLFPIHVLLFHSFILRDHFIINNQNRRPFTRQPKQAPYPKSAPAKKPCVFCFSFLALATTYELYCTINTFIRRKQKTFHACARTVS